MVVLTIRVRGGYSAFGVTLGVTFDRVYLSPTISAPYTITPNLPTFLLPSALLQAVCAAIGV